MNSSEIKREKEYLNDEKLSKIYSNSCPRCSYMYDYKNMKFLYQELINHRYSKGKYSTIAQFTKIEIVKTVAGELMTVQIPICEKEYDDIIATIKKQYLHSIFFKMVEEMIQRIDGYTDIQIRDIYKNIKYITK